MFDQNAKIIKFKSNQAIKNVKTPYFNTNMIPEHIQPMTENASSLYKTMISIGVREHLCVGGGGGRGL